jgi:hypothetical protein
MSTWIELLKVLGYFAGLSIVIIAAWRGARAMISMGRRLDGIEKRFLDMWLTAEQIGSTRPRIISELVGYENWDTSLVRGLIKSARTRVIVFQTWFPEMEGDLDRWEFSNPDKLRVEIFMAHPANPAVLERVRFRKDFSLQDTDEELRASIGKNVGACAKKLISLFEEIKKKNKNFSGTVSLYHKGTPFAPVYIIDGLALFGIYPPQVNCNAAPMFRLSASDRSGRLLEEAVNTIKHASQRVYSTDDESVGGDLSQVLSSLGVTEIKSVMSGDGGGRAVGEASITSPAV